MNCLLDATVNLKHLVVEKAKKLLVDINGQSMIESQFKSMRLAGITQVFILIEQDDELKGVISRVAMNFGFSPTFLEVEKEQVAARMSIKVAEPYLKDSFVYIPINHLLSATVLKEAIGHSVNAHQVLSIIYSGDAHPQVGKKGLYRTEYSSASEVFGDNQAKNGYGYDLGVYVCSPIIFKLIDRIIQNKGFSWHKLLAVLSRAGKSMIYSTQSRDWGVIETVQDVETISSLQASLLSSRINLNRWDKSLLANHFGRVIPKLPKSTRQRLLLYGLNVLLLMISLFALSQPYWFVQLICGVVASLCVVSLPLFGFLSGGNKVHLFLEPRYLFLIRATLLFVFSITTSFAFGLNGWMILGAAAIGIEIFFELKPVPSFSLESYPVFSSYSVHALLILLCTLIFLPGMSLLVALLFSIGLSSMKSIALYQEIQKERND